MAGVSPSALKRLSDDVTALEKRFQPRKAWRSIYVHNATFLDQEAVLERHYQLFPEDRDPSVIFVTTYEDASMDGPDTRENRAWRELAREAGYKPSGRPQTQQGVRHCLIPLN